MAALELNNFMLPTSPYLGYARTDINNFIRNCYATNDPTNNINKIMTIEEDDEDDDENECFGSRGEDDVGSTVYFEKRFKRIEDWNKVYNSDDENSVVIGSGSDNGDEGGGGVDENKAVVFGEVLEGGEKPGIVEKIKRSDSVRSTSKSLKVTFADDFGCELFQNFIIKSTTDDEDEEEGGDKEATDDGEEEEEDEIEASSACETDDSDKENSSDASKKDKHRRKKKKNAESDDFESLEMTINKLINSEITISDCYGDICFSSGGDIDLGGDTELGSSGGDIDLGGAIGLGSSGGDIDLGASDLGGKKDDVGAADGGGGGDQEAGSKEGTPGGGDAAEAIIDKEFVVDGSCGEEKD